MGVDELKPFAGAGFEQFCHRLIAGCVQQPIEVECGQESVLTIRNDATVRIELRIDNGDILGMVTLFNEEKRVVFSDIPDIGNSLASHRWTGESVVHTDHMEQQKSCYKETHCNIRPFMDATRQGLTRGGRSLRVLIVTGVNFAHQGEYLLHVPKHTSVLKCMRG